MEKKLDTYLIYLIYIFEFIYTISSLYLNGHAISISEMIKKMPIFDNVFQIAYCMIFIVGILYVLFLLYKIGQHKIIDLKKNTGLLFGIIFMDSAISIKYPFFSNISFREDAILLSYSTINIFFITITAFIIS